MKKGKIINTITFHYAHNYGAVWQAYALMKFIQNLGAECEILDYIPESERKYCNTPYIRNSSLKALTYNLLNGMHGLKLSRGCKQFTSFREEYFNCTKKRYFSEEELKNAALYADVFIAGSDQIWNCENGILDVYFMDFVRGGKIKASYAASIGTETICSEYEAEFFKKIKGISYLSIRENTALKYIQHNTKVAVYEHIDPVFLLEQSEWKRMAQKCKIPYRYILVFSLGRSRKITEMIMKLKKETELKVIEVCLSGVFTLGADKRQYDIGPSEMLYMIQHAEYVITNSFHVTAMSIVLHKEFYAIPKNYSSRIKDMLNKFCVSGRCIEQIPDRIAEVTAINYDKVDKIIAEERYKSKIYLEKIIA